MAISYSFVAADATSGPRYADPAIANAIGLIGDLYRKGKIDTVNGEAALTYYFKLSSGDGRVLAALPPEQLIATFIIPPKPDGKSAAHVYKIAANLGNPDAFLRLGDLYNTGDLIEANPQLAFDYYQKAAALGSESASVNIGLMMIEGSGTTQDIPGGLAFLIEAADKENTQALMALGKLYRTGDPNGITSDLVRSFEYYKRAADGGSSAATVITARMMIDGEGTIAAPEKGYDVARRLLEGKDPAAMLLMGDLLLKGIPGVLSPDASKAFEFYRQAGESGSATGRSQTAFMMVRGQGAAQDVESGVRILEEMAVSGDTSAMHTLGQLFETGVETSLPADASKAFAYYETAASKGNPRSSLRMAFMLIAGNGTMQNSEGGVEILESLAAEGLSGANLMLAEYYSGAIGSGDSVDLPQAYSFYQQAAARGSKTGRIQTALMLLRGEGTARDYDVGISLLQAVANEGDPDALLALGTVFASGEAGEVDAKAAIAAFEEAAALGELKANILLGDLFSRGEVIPPDGELAVFYYKKAAGIVPATEGAAAVTASDPQ
ncbi:MAG: hypothetical protein ABJQ21_23765 [Roseibium sp.]